MKNPDWVGARVDAFVKLLLEWSRDNFRKFMWRERLSNPYEVLCAEILLQKTSAHKVEPIYELFLRNFPTQKELAAANLEEVKKIIEPTGLQNKKAFALIEAAKLLARCGVNKNSIQKLRGIKGISSYTINSVLSFCYGDKVPILDINVKRVLGAVFGVVGSKEVNLILSKCLEQLENEDLKRFYFAILDLGANLKSQENFLNSTVAIVPVGQNSLKQFLEKNMYWRFKFFEFKRPVRYLAFYSKSPTKAVTYLGKIEKVKSDGVLTYYFISKPIALTPPIEIEKGAYPPMNYKFTTLVRVLRARSYSEL